MTAMLDVTRWKRGYVCMADAIESKGDLGGVMTRLYDGDKSQVAADHFSGALCAVLTTYFKLRALGKTPHYKDKEVESFMHQSPGSLVAQLDIGLAKKDPTVFRQMGWICGAVLQYKGRINCVLVDGHGKPVFPAREDKI